MEIYVYKGEFGLPSVELDCIRILVGQLVNVNENF